MQHNLLERSLKVIREEGVVSFVGKVARKIIHYLTLFFIPYAIYKLRKEIAKISKVEELVDLAFNFKINGLNIAPVQIKEEILELLKILRKIKPKTILEIGTANGGTLFLFSQIVDKNATIISIDLPGGKFGGGYPKWKIPLYKSFAKDTQKIYLIRADSHKEETLRSVKNILGNKKVDFLFIDGDHTYEGVKRDFEMYSPFVRKGGIVAFHDIVHGPTENVGGVPIFWKEIKKHYKHLEIVKDWNQGGCGIGLIFYKILF